MSTSGAADVDEIRHRAYQLWNQDGCPEGRAVEYWLRAEAELGTAGAAEPSAPAPQAADEPRLPPRTPRGSPKAGSGGGKAAKATPAAAASSDVAEARDTLVRQRRTREKAEG